MFQSDPVWWVKILKVFIGVWIYGHGWFIPVYYGAIYLVACFIRDRFNISWASRTPMWLFVFALSGCHGALCAVIISCPLLFMTPKGDLNFIFFILLISNIYSFLVLVKSIRLTLKNEIEKSLVSLKRGLIVLAPSVLLLFFIGDNLANSP